MPTSFLPQREPGGALRDVGRLVLASAVFLLVQESIERSTIAGALQLATFSPLSLAVAAVVLVVAAATVVTLERTLDGLGVRKRATNEKARSVLGWAPRGDREAVVATAESLLALGLVK